MAMRFSGQCIMARVQTRQTILTIQFFIHLDTKPVLVHRLLLCFLSLLFSLFCHSLFLFVSCHLKPFRLFLLSLNLCLSFYFTPILYDEAFLGITMGIKFGATRTVLPRISSKPSCDSERPSNNKIYLVASLLSATDSSLYMSIFHKTNSLIYPKISRDKRENSLK